MSSSDKEPAPDQVIDEVLKTWPTTIPVFMRHKMACVGCSMAPFETVAEAASTYGLQVRGFVEELCEAAKEGKG